MTQQPFQKEELTLLTKLGAQWEKAQRLRPLRAFSRFTDVGGNVLAAGMSFQALFAVFASLWVASGVLAGWLRNRPELLDQLAVQVNSNIPGLIAVDGEGAIELQELLGRQSFGISGIIASLSLIWVAISWFTSTRRAVRLIYGLEVRMYRNAVLLKLLDFLGSIVFFLAILVSAVLTLASSNLFTWALELVGLSEGSWLVNALGLSLRWVATLAADVLLLMSINRLLAEVNIPLKNLFWGSLAGGIGLLGLKLLAGFALGGATSNPLLATFAVFVGLLVWFNLVCRILLLTSAWIAAGVDETIGLPEPGPSKLDLNHAE